MKDNTGHQLLMISEALKQDQRNYLHEVEQGQARIAELEALLGECRLALCPFDCKLLLLRIDTALAKKELSE